MMKEIPRSRYDAGTERMLRQYEEAGLSPVQCMSDVTSAKARYAQADGYADGVLVGGVSLILAGIICKWLSKKEIDRQVQYLNNRVQYAMSIRPLTDFKVPGSEDEEREENND
jgi:hypothetical protein